MTNKNYLLPIFNLIVPSLIFYLIYKLLGLIPAIVLSVFYSSVMLIVGYRKTKKIKNTQVLGILGLLISGVSIIWSGNANLYYVPALASNTILTVTMVILAVRHRSILHYLAKDFGVKSLEAIPEQKMVGLNYLWIAFFLLKIASKMVGIFYLDFDKLYWLVFALGDPAMVCMILISVIYIKRKASAEKIKR